MNSYLKSGIIYLQLFVFALQFSISASVNSDYNGFKNQKSDIAVVSNYIFSDVINMRDNHSSKEERLQQKNSGGLFLIFGSIIIANQSFFVVHRKQSLIISSTPDYLLSSDLKSPPSFI